MQRAERILRKGSFAAELASDRVCLDFDRRHRRRLALSTESRRCILLDLPEATHMRDGDAMALGDGSLVLIAAESEPLIEITAQTPDELTRIAWHLGNRHLPAQLLKDAIRIREDHVIAEMVRGLGGETKAISAPFDPEGGAYAAHGDSLEPAPVATHERE